MSKQKRRRMRDVEKGRIWKVIDDYSGFAVYSDQVKFDWKGCVTQHPDPIPLQMVFGPLPEFDHPLPFTNHLDEEFVNNDPPTS